MGSEVGEDVSVRSQDGFTEWVTPHWPAMSLLARRLSGAEHAEDVLQDALVLAWRKRAQFDDERGTARTWLLTLVADCARKQRRTLLRRIHTTFLQDEPPAPPVGARDLDVDRAIDRLSQRQRLAVGLYYFLGLTVGETASSCAARRAR